MIEQRLLVYTDELLKLQKELTRKHIRAVYLKGFIQHFFLTKQWPKKNPIDIDILIPPGTFRQTNLVLKSLGYSMHLPYKNPAARPQIGFVKSHALMPIVCDVHNQIFFPTKYIFNVLPPRLVKQITLEFTKRANTITFQNQKFRILEPEDMLLHQCLNFFFHNNCNNQQQVYNISLVIERTNINWETVLSRLSLWNLKEFAYHPLLLTKKISGARIPGFVLKKLRPKNLLAFFSPLFINSKTVGLSIKNMHLRFRYNIFLRLLISNQPLLKKIREVFLLIVFPIKSRPKE